MTRVRLMVTLALVSALVAMFGASTALAYEFPSTNAENQASGAPYVAEVDSGPGWITLAFHNPKNYGANFEYRIDGQVRTDGDPHPVVIGDYWYVPSILLPNSGSSPTHKTFYAYETVEIRLARGAERDHDFDWTPFDVPSPTNCVFDTVGTTMTLLADCTTAATIYVPDGYTLDGNGFTITAVDPGPGSFTGAVVANAGMSMNVVNLGVSAENLKIVCHAGDARLAGIKLAAASGTIAYNTVIGINQGASGCQEGNAIEVRNLVGYSNPPLPAETSVTVEIAYNTVSDYQKTGILVSGNVHADIHHNWVGDSATQANLAANSVQLSYGASGSITHNTVYGNQWFGASNYAATALLVLDAKIVEISKNNIRGNSDVGIYLSLNDEVIVDNNRVFDDGEDGNQRDYDYGIGAWDGDGDTLTNNKVRGFDTPYDGLGEDIGSNKVIGQPAD